MDPNELEEAIEAVERRKAGGVYSFDFDLDLVLEAAVLYLDLME